MGFLDSLGDVLRQATAEGASTAEVHDAYDQVARAVPEEELAGSISDVFNSDQTPPFEQMLSGLFNQSNPQQKAGILNQILGALGPGGLGQLLSSLGGLGGLGGLLSGGRVTPAQAEQISPEQVEVLAQHAARHDPSIVDAAGRFYAQHSTLVKALGAGALALVMSRLSQQRR
ncbi:MAG: hypothetical protein ABIT01_15195 [Thermoanaerobaculia bacterium]